MQDLKISATAVEEYCREIREGFPIHLQDDNLRQQLKDHAQRILDALTAPNEILDSSFVALWDLAALRYTHRFGIAKHIPIGENVSFDALAKAAQVDETQLRHIIRHLVTKQIFQVTSDGKVAHTPASAMLLDDVAGAFNHYTVEDLLPIVSNHVEVLQTWGHGNQDPHQTTFHYSKKTNLLLFEYLEKHAPEERERFTLAMQYLSRSPGMSIMHLVRSFPWSQLGNATLVDVGGGAGYNSAAIAQAFPKISCVVQDLPATIHRGLKSSPAYLHSRIRFMRHNFFDKQPVPADVYLLRLILHDWPRAQSVDIIRNITTAMKPGTRILIMDQCFQGPGFMRLADERLCTGMNMAMQITLNSAERTELEWRELIQEADERLVVKAIIHPRGSLLSIIDAELT